MTCFSPLSVSRPSTFFRFCAASSKLQLRLVPRGDPLPRALVGLRRPPALPPPPELAPDLRADKMAWGLLARVSRTKFAWVLFPSPRARSRVLAERSAESPSFLQVVQKDESFACFQMRAALTKRASAKSNGQVAPVGRRGGPGRTVRYGPPLVPATARQRCQRRELVGEAAGVHHPSQPLRSNPGFKGLGGPAGPCDSESCIGARVAFGLVQYGSPAAHFTVS